MASCSNSFGNRRLGKFGCALLMPLVSLVLLQASVHAQDIEAVKKRLIEAVSADELSFGQAAAMMGALEHSRRPTAPHAWGTPPHRPGFAPGGKPLPGKPEMRQRPTSDAAPDRPHPGGPRWFGAGRPLPAQTSGEAGKLPEAQAKIMAAAKAGEITREQAREKMMALRNRSAGENPPMHPPTDWEAVKKRVEGAVESGKMTREQANRIYEGIKQRHKMQDSKKAADQDKKVETKRDGKATADKGHADKGHGDKGHADKAHGDKAHGDKGHGDKGHGDKGHGDKAHADGNREKPRGDQKRD